MRAAHAASLVSHAHAEPMMRPARRDARNALCTKQITTKKTKTKAKKKRRRRRRATCAGPGRDALSEDER